MAEETYELRLNPEGFQIIPVGVGRGEGDGQEQQIAVQHGQIAVQLLQQDKLKVEPSNLFLEPRVRLVETETIPPKLEPDHDQQLVIQYGENWFQDLLCSLADLGPKLMDYPIFCVDGIFWTNRLLLASFATFLTPSLAEDSCLILPDFSLAEVTTFHQQLFERRPSLSAREVGSLSRTGSLFGFHMFTLNQGSGVEGAGIDYPEIFRAQKDEIFTKMFGGNTEVVECVLSVAEKPKRIQSSNPLLEMLFPSAQNQEQFNCDECGRCFSQEVDLQSHMNTLHSVLGREVVRSHPCGVCGKMFAFRVNVKRHMLLVHPHYKDVGPGEVVGEDVPELDNGEEECQNANMTDLYDGRKRARGNTPNFPQLEKFRCKICGEFQKSKRGLVAHIQCHYGGGYKCDFPGCSSVFRENAKLTRHKLVHTGVKAFKCSFCHLSFSLRHNLKMHERTHTRKDLHKCRICDYETIQKSNLRLHEATHFRPTSRPHKGRPAGRYSGAGGSGKEVGDTETPDEIEKFIAEMEKDQSTM